MHRSGQGLHGRGLRRREALSRAEASRFLGATPDGSKALYLDRRRGEGRRLDLYEFRLAEAKPVAEDRRRGAGRSWARAKTSRSSTSSPPKRSPARGRAPGRRRRSRAAQPLPLRGRRGRLLPLHRHPGGGRRPARRAKGNRRGPRSARSPGAGRPRARVTADGLHLAFTSFGQPTGYDNTDAAKRAARRRGLPL